MKRQIQQQFTQQGLTAYRILKFTNKHNYWLIDELRKNLARSETIDVHSWIENLFYIVVEDNRPGWKYPEDIRIGFTVDIAADTIFWSKYDPSRPSYTNGGNCFVRTNKWKAFLKHYFPEQVKEDKIHWYRNVYLKKEE